MPGEQRGEGESTATSVESVNKKEMRRGGSGDAFGLKQGSRPSTKRIISYPCSSYGIRKRARVKKNGNTGGIQPNAIISPMVYTREEKKGWPGKRGELQHNNPRGRIETTPRSKKRKRKRKALDDEEKVKGKALKEVGENHRVKRRDLKPATKLKAKELRTKLSSDLFREIHPLSAS